MEVVSWRSIFLINVSLGAFVLWASQRHVPRDPRSDRRRADRPAGLGSGHGWLAGVTFAVIQTPEEGIGSPAVMAAITVGLAGLLAFLRRGAAGRSSDASALDLLVAPVHEHVGALQAAVLILTVQLAR